MERHIALWADLMEGCNEFLLAEFRREFSNEADVLAACRAGYAPQMDAHDPMMLHMMREFHRRGTGHGA